MIYIEIFSKWNTIGGDIPYKVIVTYPNEEDFMKDRVIREYEPLSKERGVIFKRGIFDKEGFKPNIIKIIGKYLGEVMVEELPSESCIIRGHPSDTQKYLYTGSKEDEPK